MKIIIAGGGTGGHIFPAVAVADALRETDPAVSVHFVGTRYGLETKLVPQAGYPISYVPIRGFVGKGLKGKLALLWRLPLSFLVSFAILLRIRPKVVVGVGGYASAPLLFCASLLRIPCMIQEQNAFPGVTNKIGSRFAALACLGFAEAGPHLRCPSVVTGNPIRGSLDKGPAWSPERKRILITGGSQGARALNRVAPGLLKGALEGQGLSVLHQCGRGKRDEVLQAYGDVSFPLEVTEFIDDMSAAFDQALVVICRAGASTIGEIKVKGLPSILVPFPAAAGDHQTFNAKSLSASGAACLIVETDLAESGAVIGSLLADREQLAAMAASVPRPQHNSAQVCAQIALALAKKTEVSQLVQTHSHVS